MTMKKGLILIGLLALTLPSVQAQEPETYFDTSFVPYWQFDWDSWVAQGSGNRVKEAGAITIINSTSGVPVVDVLQYNYTNDTAGMEIWGLRVSVRTVDPQLGLNPPEYLLLYDAKPDTFELKAEIPWNPSDPELMLPVEFHQHSNNDPCPANYRVMGELAYKEYLFNQPIRVRDSFYVGTTDRYGVWVLEALGATDIDYAAMGFSHDGVNNQPIYNCMLSWGSDTSCIPMPFLWKVFNYNSSQQDMPFNQWAWIESNQFLLVLPLVRKITEVQLPACTDVEEFRISGRMGAVTEFQWVSDGLHNEWELSYGIEGTPPDSGTVLTLTEPRYWLNDNAYPDTPMVAYIRTVCREQGILRHGRWSAGIHWDGHLIHQGIPAEGIGAYVELLPNPAKGMTVVSSSYRLSRIRAYNMQGQQVLDQRPSLSQSATLDLTAWPKGTYLLRITTLAGIVSKKLVVE